MSVYLLLPELEGRWLQLIDGSSAEAAAACSPEESFSSQQTGPCDRTRSSTAIQSCSSVAAPFHYSRRSAASM